MQINTIHCGDAQKLLPQVTCKPKLIIMSPPDISETNYSLDEYRNFLKSCYSSAASILDENGIIASITTDRKMNSKIYTKHMDIINFTPLELFNYKIWAKSLKTNLYILNYCHMLFFKKGKVTNNKIKDFYPDVWLLDLDKVSWYKNKDSFPTDLVERIVLNFTKENDLVLDPFMGTGKTAKVAIKHNRNYLGFDLDQNIVNLALQNL